MTLLRRLEIILLVLAIAAGAWWLMVTAVRADTIKPTCWEEKQGDDVLRHCEVNRPAAAKPPTRPPPVQASAPPLPPPVNAEPQLLAPQFGGRFYGPPRALFFRIGPLMIVIQ